VTCRKRVQPQSPRPDRPLHSPLHHQAPCAGRRCEIANCPSSTVMSGQTRGSRSFLLTTPFGRDTSSLKISSVRAPNSVLFLKRSVAGSIMASRLPTTHLNPRSSASYCC
jgi:hypothetical protein